MMRAVTIISLLLVAAGCSKCGGADNDTPNNQTNSSLADMGDAGVDAPSANSNTGGPEFVRRVPLEGLAGNLLEDPNFGFQNESWFGVDNSNELHRMRRIYEPGSPENRPIAGIIPAQTTVCLLGRMKWGSDNHRASVWVGRAEGDDSGEVTANVLGIEPTPEPSWTSTALEPTSETADHGGGRRWTRWETTAAARFGWGYLEVCANADDTVFVGAPTVVEFSGANTLSAVRAAHRATRLQVQRVEAFERWRRAR